MVNNANDQFVASRVIIFNSSGKDLWDFFQSKEKKGSFKNHKDRGRFHREELNIQGINVYDAENPKHQEYEGATWLATSFVKSNFTDERVFNKYEQSKGKWFEMSGDNFATNDLMSVTGRKKWIGKILSKYRGFDFQFKSVKCCEKDGNVYGGLIVRKPEVTFLAIYNGEEVSRVIIHDKHGLDLRKFILSKEKQPKFQSAQDRGTFQREQLFIQDMHVYDPENSYHIKNSEAAWYVTSFEKSNFHDEALFLKYKSSKGGWYEMKGDDFYENNLRKPEGRKTWEAKIQEKYEDWNIRYEVHCI